MLIPNSYSLLFTINLNPFVGEQPPSVQKQIHFLSFSVTCSHYTLFLQHKKVVFFSRSYFTLVTLTVLLENGLIHKLHVRMAFFVVPSYCI